MPYNLDPSHIFFLNMCKSRGPFWDVINDRSLHQHQPSLKKVQGAPKPMIFSLDMKIFAMACPSNNYIFKEKKDTEPVKN